MKYYLNILTILLLSSPLITMDFPGGYIGVSLNYGSNRTIGLQGSFGIVASSSDIGAVFPGVSTGIRYSLKNQNTSLYVDAQFVLMAGGFWIGAAKGLIINENQKSPKEKFFAGFLPVGFFSEKISLNDEIQKHRGLHLGMALPLLGSQFKP